MASGREGEEGDILVSQRVITEQSQATIKSVLDALVELITNSDDSYRRLEEDGIVTPGRIAASVQRQRGGQVSNLVISDWAEGMTLDRILEVLEFAADTSGFTAGRNLRGLFGKGLKESIFALGSGQITSVRDGRLSAVYVWHDTVTRRYRFRIEDDSVVSSEPNNTRISITVSNQRITSPQWRILKEQFSTHFALRDICSSRIVELTLHDTNITNTEPMVYTEPPLSRVVQEDINVAEIGNIHLVIGESESPLHLGSRDPCSIAGIVVKTEGIPLDNRAFGFESDDAAKYFAGTVEVPFFAQAVRSGDFSLLDPSRTGLDLRSSLVKKLQAAIEKILGAQIDRKRRELEAERHTATKEVHRQRLRDVCDLLNTLAEEEIEDIPGFGTGVALLEGLVLRPSVGYSRPSEQRRFSVYLPAKMVGSTINPRVTISVEDAIGTIWLSADSITLKPSPSRRDVLTGNFNISGASEGDLCTLYAQWNTEEDMAEFRVREPSSRNSTDPARNRGLFREIVFDDQAPSPIQRVSFSHGNITVFLNFPAVSRYLGPGGEGLDTPQGSLMCAELVAEAFSREIARRRVESGVIVSAPGGEIDAYNSELNTLSRKYLETLHRALVIPTP